MHRYDQDYKKDYFIDSAVNLDPHNCFKNKDTYPDFQEHLKIFKKELVRMVNNNESKTFYKFGDGEHYFLNRAHVGTANPGNRDLSKSYDQIKHEEFVDGVCKNDFITVEIYPENRAYFSALYPKRKIDFPAEYSYGLVANKWLTKTFSGELGIIGAGEKIGLIEKMMTEKEYQDYLGIDKFEDYIHMPQKFVCDDIDKTERIVAKQLEKSKSKIFLLGIGLVKSALLHRLKKYKDAVFIDVGSSIDALAGIVDHDRPYMGNWKNYRINSCDYSRLDTSVDYPNGRIVFDRKMEI